MKGTRAKKAAEAAEREAAAAAGLEPTPPSEAREGGARPGPIVQASKVLIPESEWNSLIGQLRTNELLGAAAADAFEAAAGLRPVASPQSKGAKELRGEVADARDDGADKKKKKGAMMFAAEEPEEIPDYIEPAEEAADADEAEAEPKAEREEPPELNLTPKQNHMRTDLEMWVMDEIPALFGVDDSEELAEELQEDGQADKITFLIAESDEGAQDKMANDWLKDAPEDARGEFVTELLEKVRAIQSLGAKKKKKKKKDKGGD